MRSFLLLHILSWLLLLVPGIATATKQHSAEGGALRGPSRLHRVAQVDERCQIPTTDKPECVHNQDDLLRQISDTNVQVILICQGATIALNLDDSIRINSNKAIICDSSHVDGNCVIDGKRLKSLQAAAFLIELVTDIHVSLCGMKFVNFGVVSATTMYAME